MVEAATLLAPVKDDEGEIGLAPMCEEVDVVVEVRDDEGET